MWSTLKNNVALNALEILFFPMGMSMSILAQLHGMGLIKPAKQCSDVHYGDGKQKKLLQSIAILYLIKPQS